MTPDALPPRFAAKVSLDEAGCWLWTGHRAANGYGEVGYHNRKHLAHRLAYTLLVGPIPDGLTIDHLCMVKHCVNPAHLEPVTLAENIKRAHRAGHGAGAANAGKTRCPRGHDYSPDNTYVRSDGRRECRECCRIRQTRAYKQLMTSLICTVCSHGHHLSCHTASCQCWCRTQMPPALREVSADLDQPTETEEGVA